MPSAVCSAVDFAWVSPPSGVASLGAARLCAADLGRVRRRVLADRAQLVDDRAHARPVLVGEPHPRQRGHHRHVLRADPQRVGEHGLGRRDRGVAHQVLGVAQRRLGRLARELDGLGELLARERVAAVALVRGRHQRRDRGVARGLVLRRPERHDRLAGLVVVDEPGRAHLQRVDVARVFGEHLLDAGPRADLVAGLGEHLREHDLDLVALVRGGGLGGQPVEDPLHRGDRLRPLPRVVVERGGERAVERRGGAARTCGGIREARELGRGGVAPARGLQKLHHGEPWGGVLGRGRVGDAAEIGLRPVDVAALEVPGDERFPHVLVGREARGHRLQLGADARHVVLPREELELGDLKLQVVRAERDRVLDLGERIGRGGAVQHPVDHHAQRHDVVGGRAQHPARGVGGIAGGVGVAGDAGLAVVERRGERLVAGRVGGERDRGAAVPLGLLPVAGVDGELGEDLARLELVGVLLDEAQVLAVGLLQVAALDHHLSIGEPGRLVGAVVLEDVAELDERAVGVAGLQEREPGLVVALGLLGPALAARERQRGAEHQDGKRGAEAHGRGFRRSAVAQRLRPGG